MQYKIFQAKIYLNKTGKLDLKDKNGVLGNFKDLFWQMVCTIFLFRVTHKETHCKNDLKLDNLYDFIKLTFSY